MERLSDNTFNDFPSDWYGIAEANHFWMKWRMQVFRLLLKDLKLLKSNDRQVLDIGCGHGVVQHQLGEFTNWKIDGIDTNTEALENNNFKGGQVYLYNILEKRSEFNQKYDFIILFDVLEHIEDTRPFIESIFFHLKAGGILFINVPAFELFFSKYDTAAGHIHRYDKSTLSNTIKIPKTEIVDMRYWGAGMVPLIVARKVMLKMTSNSDQEILNKGFRPPHDLFNKILIGAMKLETRLFRQEFFGTSLMAAIKKV